MNVFVKLMDESLQGEKTAAVVIELDVERIAARDLVRLRVEEEVRRHNDDQAELYQGLVQPTDSERTLNGLFKLKKKRALDPAAQVEIALKAFEQNGFFMLVDDRQVESLDEVVVLRPDLEVSFLRLVPLVGG